jgi:hypothetical protein
MSDPQKPSELSFLADPRVLSQLLAKPLRGRAIPDSADKARTAMQKEFDAAKKAVKDKREEIKKRGLRGKDRKAAVEAEVSPLVRNLHAKRQSWLVALKAAVPSSELAIGKHIDCTNDEFRIHATDFLADAGHANRETIDLLTAFGSDACLQKSGRIAATPFCFITGSGHQYFLDTVRQLMDAVAPERVHAALFEPWTYRDKKLSMRWDPIEDRRYALMDRDPTASDNESSTVWRANLLAYRALVLFPSAPSRKGLATTGWCRGDAPAFTWPIWEDPAHLDTIRSLLQVRALSAANPDRSVLRARGIAAAFRARRIEVGSATLKKVNLAPLAVSECTADQITSGVSLACTSGFIGAMRRGDRCKSLAPCVSAVAASMAWASSPLFKGRCLTSSPSSSS